MADERSRNEDIEVPRKIEQADLASQADGTSCDPADIVPVPIAMSAAEIDQRAEAVEAVRENARENPSEDPCNDVASDTAVRRTFDSDSRAEP